MPRMLCPHCNKRLLIKDDLLGKKLNCPACGKVLAATLGGSTGVPAAKPEHLQESTTQTARFPAEGQRTAGQDSSLPQKKENSTTLERTKGCGTLTFACRCGQSLRAPVESRGEAVRCPSCGHKFKLADSKLAQTKSTGTESDKGWRAVEPVQTFAIVPTRKTLMFSLRWGVQYGVITLLAWWGVAWVFYQINLVLYSGALKPYASHEPEEIYDIC
jgi:DNA-directed RNA polymerase subunit M/transcription elongation factor TFIIS